MHQALTPPMSGGTDGCMYQVAAGEAAGFGVVGGWKAICQLALAAGLLFAPLPGEAADPAAGAPGSPGARPRIGLVLGGGGAKGAAHIGVIKVLEELRIPVDCIAGTSMGAIVGAAYATGLSAGALEKVITDVNWKETLKSAPREEFPVHRKAQDFIFTLGLELGVKDGSIQMPLGFVPTHQIEALFRRIVSEARQTSHFDDLPIPFRAVATDLESGAVKVFDHGDLAVAMRASMAVPGAFAPVDYEGHLYADGMLVRNLPVDVARKTCADVVIAVPVGNPAMTRANITSALSVLGQAMNIAIESNEKAQIATLTQKDVEIPVILTDITSGDFDKVPEAIPIGEAAARKAIAGLERYSLSPWEYGLWRARLKEVAGAPKGLIDEVRIVGTKSTNPEVMRTFIAAKPGEPFDPAKADADTSRLVARGDYSAVSYGLVTENSRNVLVYSVTEKSIGPDILKVDMNLESDLTADTLWGIRATYEKRWLNALGGELRLSGQVGRPNAFNGEFYQPLEKSQTFFVAPSIYGFQTIQYLFQGDSPVAQMDVKRYGARLEGGAALASWGEVRLGVLRGGVNVSKKVGEEWVMPSGYNNAGGATLRFSYDQLDQRLFPKSGSTASVQAYSSQTGLGADQSYRTVEARWSTVFSSGRNVWQLGLRGGTDMSSNAPTYDQFKVGGLFNFSGYRPQQLVGREYALAGVTYRRRIGDLSKVIGTGIYAGASLEAGNVYQRADGLPSRGALVSGSLYLAIDSKLGPAYFAYGLSEGGHSTIYLYLGSSLDAF